MRSVLLESSIDLLDDMGPMKAMKVVKAMKAMKAQKLKATKAMKAKPVESLKRPASQARFFISAVRFFWRRRRRREHRRLRSQSFRNQGLGVRAVGRKLGSCECKSFPGWRCSPVV